MSSVTDQDPKALANYRFAKGAVIILGVLIVIAVIGLILGFAFRSPHRPPPPPIEGDVARIVLPQGAQVISAEVEHDRLVLHVRSPAGDEIDIVDTGTGRLVGQVKVPSGAGAPAH